MQSTTSNSNNTTFTKEERAQLRQAEREERQLAKQQVREERQRTKELLREARLAAKAKPAAVAAESPAPAIVVPVTVAAPVAPAPAPVPVAAPIATPAQAPAAFNGIESDSDSDDDINDDSRRKDTARAARMSACRMRRTVMREQPEAVADDIELLKALKRVVKLKRSQVHDIRKSSRVLKQESAALAEEQAELDGLRDALDRQKLKVSNLIQATFASLSIAKAKDGESESSDSNDEEAKMKNDNKFQRRAAKALARSERKMWKANNNNNNNNCKDNNNNKDCVACKLALMQLEGGRRRHGGRRHC